MLVPIRLRGVETNRSQISEIAWTIAVPAIYSAPRRYVATLHRPGCAANQPRRQCRGVRTHACSPCCAADGQRFSVLAFAGSQHMQCWDETHPAHLGPRPSGPPVAVHKSFRRFLCDESAPRRGWPGGLVLIVRPLDGCIDAQLRPTNDSPSRYWSRSLDGASLGDLPTGG